MSLLLSSAKLREIEGLLEEEFSSWDGDILATHKKQRNFLKKRGYPERVIDAFLRAY